MRHQHLLLHSTVLSGLIVAPLAAFANPMGGNVVGGSATISESGDTLTIQQHSDKAIIDWSSFDIDANQTTRFVQNSSNSIALNRIKDTKPSNIQGNLQANGIVILVNPNGVMFGPNSQVNVNSLIVSTADVANDDFMNQSMVRFSQPGAADAKIINDGTITAAQAGLIGFVAPSVENNGTLVAQMGKVQLASGDGFTLDLAGDGLTQITVTGDVAQQLVKNSGLIEADGGLIALTAAQARTAVDALMVNTGTLRADTISEHQGEIRLSVARGIIRNDGLIHARGGAGERGGKVHMDAPKIQQNGTVDVSGAQGGSVDMQADEMLSAGDILARGSEEMGGAVAVHVNNLFDSTLASLIDVSSTGARGGSIVIEGDDNADIYARGAYMASGALGGNIDILSGREVMLLGALINTNGTNSGGYIRIGGDYLGGGSTRRSRHTLVDENSRLHADTLDSGDGGRVIVWSDGDTQFDGKIYARGGANGGKGGFAETSGKQTLKIGGLAYLNSIDETTYGVWLLDPTDITINNRSTPGNLTSTFSTAQIETMSASANVTLSATNNITFAIGTDNITLTANRDLTLSAGNNISTTSGIGTIRASGTGGIFYTAVGNITHSTDLSLRTDTGNIELKAGRSVSFTGGGDLTTAGGNIILNSDTADAENGVISVSTGSVVTTTNGGSVFLVGGSSGNGYARALNNTWGVYINGSFSVNGSLTIKGKGGNIAGGSNHGINFSTSGSITLTGNGDVNLYGTGGTAGNSNYGINMPNAVTITSTGNGTMNIYGAGGSGTSSNALYMAGNNVIGHSAGSFTGAINIDAGSTAIVDGGGSFNTIRANTLSFTNVGSVNAAALTLTAATGAINITATNGDMLFYSVTTANTSGNTLSLKATGYVRVTTSIRGYSITVNSDSDANQTGYIYLGGITGGGGSILLGGGANAATYAYGDSSSTYLVGVTTGIITGNGSAITIRGHGGTYTSGGNYGISTNIITGGAAASITLEGVGGSAGNNNHGMVLSNLTATGSGVISLTGTAGSGTGSYAINKGSSTIGNTGTFTGTINLDANNGTFYSTGGTVRTNTGGAVNFLNMGSIDAFGTSVITASNSISITATNDILLGIITTSTTAGNTVSVTAGGYIRFSSSITGYGVTLNADSDANGTGFVYLAGTVTGGGGDILIGGGAGAAGYATGDNSSTYKAGVYVGNTISGSGGNVTIRGQGGTYASGTNYGVQIQGDVTNTGTGTILVDGIGGSVSNSNHGVHFVNNGDLRSTGSGQISLLGTAGGGTTSYGVNFAGTSVLGTATTYSGAIVVTTDTINTSATTTVSTTSTATFKTRTANTIRLGDSGTGTLQLTNTFLNNITSGGIIIGDRSNTTGMEINTTTAFAESITLLTAANANVTLSNQLTSSYAGNAIILVVGGDFTNSVGASGLNASDAAGRKYLFLDDDKTHSLNGMTFSQTRYDRTWENTVMSGYSTSTLFYDGSDPNPGPGTVTITAQNASKTYGDAAPSFTYVISGGTSSDFTVLGQWYTLSCGAGADCSNAGSYTISVNSSAFTALGGVTLDLTPTATYTISKADITLTANNASKTYGNAVTFNGTEYTITTGSLKGSDAISSLTIDSLGKGAAADVGSGTYAISASNAVFGTGSASNYNITYAGGTLTVNKATLTASLSGTVSKVYDGTNSATLASGNYSVSGIVGSDDVSLSGYSSGTYNDKNAGTGKTVSVSGLGLTGTKAANYQLASTSASGAVGTVTTKDLNVSATGVDKIYDATTAATATLGSDKVLGDTVSLAYTGASFADKNVANGKTVTVSGISISGADSGNYNLVNTGATTTANITPYTITVGATGVNKTYDGLADASVTYSDNRLGSDTLTISGTAAYADKDAANGKTINVTGITLGGADAGNYTLAATTATTSANIAKRTLNVSAAASDRVYDATNTATVSLSNDKVAGDTLTVNYTSSTFANKNAGTGKTVTVSGLSLGGADANNYTLASASATTTASITPYALTITGVAANNKTYDGTTNATLDVSGASLSAALGGDVVTFSGPAAGTFASKNVANGINVTTGAFTLSDSNYSVTPVVLSANITPATLVITANNINKVYGQLYTFAGTEFSTSGLGTGDSITSATISSAGRLAGASVAGGPYAIAISNATGSFTLSNYNITYTGGTMNVTPAALTITAHSFTKEPGAVDPSLTYSYSGFVNGDTAALLTGALQRAAGEAAGQYAISQHTLSAGSNYAIYYTMGYMTIRNPIASIIIPVNVIRPVVAVPMFVAPPAVKPAVLQPTMNNKPVVDGSPYIAPQEIVILPANDGGNESSDEKSKEYGRMNPSFGGYFNMGCVTDVMGKVRCRAKGDSI